MDKQDTVKLLRECDAGVKMGIRSIDDVLDKVSSDGLKECLTGCRSDHDALNGEIKRELDAYGDEGKDPAVIARGMSWIKTGVEMLIDDSDSTIADLMTDGCNMGIKSLHRYLNQYKAADERSKALAKKLAALEEQLVRDMRRYL